MHIGFSDSTCMPACSSCFDVSTCVWSDVHACVLQHLFDGGEEGALVCRSCPGGGRVWVYYAYQECGGTGEDGGGVALTYIALAYDGDSYARWGKRGRLGNLG